MHSRVDKLMFRITRFLHLSQANVLLLSFKDMKTNSFVVDLFYTHDGQPRNVQNFSNLLSSLLIGTFYKVPHTSYFIILYK
jgi:hypothetical protein